jgi:DNA-binding LacI/PurR family transcriptional regulator
LAIGELRSLAVIPTPSTAKERIEGYQLALARLGLQFDPLLLIPSTPTRRGGHDSVQRLLQMEKTPDCNSVFQ